MRCCSTIIFFIVSIITNGQTVSANLEQLQKCLSTKDYIVSEIKVCTQYNPTIYIGWFAGKHREVNVNERCIYLRYTMSSSKDKFSRELYIPLSIYRGKTGRIYYSDRWIAGPHFDHQGGSIDVNEVYKKVIKNINYSSK